MTQGLPVPLQGEVFDLWGVLVSSFAVYSAAALAVLVAIRPLLARLGFQRAIWNPPLAELGLLVCLLGLMVLNF
jgi:uncharacterized protein DUF1656